MVSITELLDWKPATLGTVADALVRSRKDLVNLEDEISAAEPPSTWRSGSAEAAGKAHERLRLRLNDMAAEVSDVAVNLDDAQARMTSAKRDLEGALTLARSHGFEINHTSGQVTDPREYETAGHGMGPSIPGSEAAERARNAQLVREIADDIGAALHAARSADLDLQKALVAARDGKVEGSDGSLAEAVVQTPTRMDDMTPQELAQLLGDDVAIHTISAYLQAEVELASFSLEGKAQADYSVMADGSVKMALLLEAGLGRGISVGDTEAEVSAGGTTALELKFDSVEEAQEFLDGLDERAMEFDGFGDYASPGSTVVTNIADYVMEQDITSFKTGVYASGSMEFDQPWARGAVEARAEAYRDWADDAEDAPWGIKLGASGEAELGDERSGYDAAASLSGEIKISDDREFDSLTLSGQISATAANERLGIAMPPGTATGQGLDVKLTVDRENPALDEIKAALADGDLDQAKDIALDNGELVVRQTTIEQIAEEEHEVSIAGQGGTVKYGASAQTANTIWFREAGHSNITQIDPADLPAHH